MKRRQLFEFNDSDWCPTVLRDFETDYLEALFAKTGLYRGVVDPLARLLEQCGEHRVVDCCAGGGGPWLSLLDPLMAQVQDLDVLLTDLYPNRRAFERMARDSGGRVRFLDSPVDVFAPPEGLGGVCTLFDALHHFPPEQAFRLLEAAQLQRRPIAVFEAVHRSPPQVLGSALIPLAVLALTPAARPFRWSRLLLTYLVPVLPAMIGWDGFVSHLRAYRREELQQMVDRLPKDGYSWEVTELGASPAVITTVLGRPTC